MNIGSKNKLPRYKPMTHGHTHEIPNNPRATKKKPETMLATKKTIFCNQIVTKL